MTTSIPSNLPPSQLARKATQVVKLVPDKAKEFRRLAEEAGLIANYDNIQPSTKYYNLSLHHGVIFLINPTPERLYELLKLARQCGDDKNFGEHNPLLALSIPIEQLNEDRTIGKYWYPIYSFDKKDGWISIEEFLRDRGFDLSDIAEDK